MKKIVQFSFALLLISGNTSYAQFFKWGVRGGSNSNSGDFANGVVTDTAGNSVFVGLIQPATVTFGYATTTYTTVTTNNATTDMYIAKVNKNGSYVWIRTIGSKSADGGSDIGMDNNNNYYVTGSVGDTADLGNSVKIQKAGGGSFAAKYNSAGVCQWATLIGPGIWESATDASGNTYAMGVFAGTTTVGTYTLTSIAGSNDVFVVKIDPSGAIVWAIRTGGGDDDFSAGGAGTGSITVDMNGNPYIAGSFVNTTTIGTTTVTASAGSKTGVVVAKLRAADGSVVWAKGADGSDVTYNNYLNGIGFSKSENALYLVGSFMGGITWGTTALTSSANYNPFVAKLDTAGVAQWAVKAASFAFVKGCGVTTDYNGNVFFTGWGQNGTVTFGTQNTSFVAAKAGYVGKITSAGTVQWGKVINNAAGAGNYNGFIDIDFGGIDADKTGNIYVVGNYSGTLALDAYNLHCNGEPTGFYDVFLAKLDPNALTGIEEQIEHDSFIVYPNPSNGMINVSLNYKSTEVTMNIFNAAGQLVFSKKINTSYTSTATIDMAGYSKGIYLTQIVTDKGVTSKRFVIE